MTAAAHLPATHRRGPILSPGRPFVSQTFDLMLIGGGLSLLTVAGLFATGNAAAEDLDQGTVLTIILLCSFPHFAASTVRLYTKPGAFRALPGMTLLFPLVSVVVLTFAMFFTDAIGSHLYKLYLTWSPYHYAAQTFGLSAMYAARAGCKLRLGERRLLWFTCMLPFLKSFAQGATFGLGWFLTPSFFMDHAALLELRWQLVEILEVVVFAAPVLLVARIYSRSDVSMPAICLLLIATNGIWWVVFEYVQAFVWAAIFHGVQYLAIVLIFHLRDHPPQGEGRAPWLIPVLKFYATCLLLGYALFELWPYAYVLAGFTSSESVILCGTIVNIHHFIVDRAIWRVRGDPGNRSAMQR